MEWVYDGSDEQEVLYEGDAYAKNEKTNQPFDLFAPFEPVEATSTASDEQEYFGSTDGDENILKPEEAFLKTIGKVYAPAEILQGKRRSVVRNKPTETRQERILKLAAELSVLQAEEEEDGSEALLADLSGLRKQLSDLENKTKPKYPTGPSGIQNIVNEASKGDNQNVQDGSEGVVLNLYAPELHTVADLERRVAALEKIVGTTHTEFCENIPLAKLMSDVKSRLDILENPGITEKLKQEARDIAEILRREVHTESGVTALQTAEILNKMKKWDGLIDTLPIIVERLRCLKRVQDEASGFVNAMHRVEETLDLLKKRKNVNEALIRNVEETLRENMKTVNNNLDLLENKLSKKS